MGAQLKAAVCILKGDTAFLSPHIGDLETPQAQDFLVESCELLKRITRCDPAIIACDLHPDYFSTRYAAGLGKKLARVQHHHAHIAACLAEYRDSGAGDRPGNGRHGLRHRRDRMGRRTDDCRYGLFSRAGHFKTFSLPGANGRLGSPGALRRAC